VNVKFFFVKQFYEYVLAPEKLLQNKIVKNNSALKAAVRFALSGNTEALNLLYQKILPMQHKQLNADLKSVYEGEIYSDTGIDGLKIDFNFGLRLDIPQGNWHVKISDYDSGQIFFDEDVSDTRLIASEGYFIRWQVEVCKDGGKIFEHTLDLRNKEVLMVFVSRAMGDSLALLPHVRAFQRLHGCRVKIFLRDYLREVVANLYPELEQVDKISFDCYATYYLSHFAGETLVLPCDCRTIPLEKVGEVNLGLKSLPPMPKFLPTKGRQIAEPYVCIAVQSSSTWKGWLYPNGWDIIVDYLKSLGYRVLCIDKHKVETGDGYKITMPKGAENFTGDIPLIERANMLYYAEFFIGLGSGLSWLAHYVGCPAVMIGGFSQDWYEFYTPCRVANRFVCNGCFNDAGVPVWTEKICPHYLGTKREFECQKKISPRQVIRAIDKLLENNC